MKPAACLLAAFALGLALFADTANDEYDEPYTLPGEHGDSLLAYVGHHSVTPSKWIRLSTNSAYMVVCQIAYRDSAFEYGPASPEEVIQARQAANCLNLALLKFLQKTCAGKSDAELVRNYRSGSIRAKVEEDFPDWFDNYVVSYLHVKHGRIPIDEVADIKVAMRAVGPLAEAVGEP